MYIFSKKKDKKFITQVIDPAHTAAGTAEKQVSQQHATEGWV